MTTSLQSAQEIKKSDKKMTHSFWCAAYTIKFELCFFIHQNGTLNWNKKNKSHRSDHWHNWKLLILTFGMCWTKVLSNDNDETPSWDTNVNFRFFLFIFSSNTNCKLSNCFFHLTCVICHSEHCEITRWQNNGNNKTTFFEKNIFIRRNASLC